MLILVDQDGPLADFDAAFTAAMRDRHPDAPAVDAATRATWKVRECYPADWHPVVDAVPAAAGFFEALPAVPGARDALEGMRAAGHDVFICTSPLSDSMTCPSEKTAWVGRELGAYWARRIIITKDKTLVRGDALIDDKPAVTGLLPPTWTHVVYDASYNRTSPGPRLRNWANWEQLLGALTARRTDAERVA